MSEQSLEVVSDKVCHIAWRFFDSGLMEYSVEPLTRVYAESLVGVLNNALQPTAVHWFVCVQELLV